jgi:hypothetical protein
MGALIYFAPSSYPNLIIAFGAPFLIENPAARPRCALPQPEQVKLGAQVRKPEIVRPPIGDKRG